MYEYDHMTSRQRTDRTKMYGLYLLVILNHFEDDFANRFAFISYQPHFAQIKWKQCPHPPNSLTKWMMKYEKNGKQKYLSG
jgi:hypothetical protein